MGSHISSLSPLGQYVSIFFELSSLPVKNSKCLTNLGDLVRQLGEVELAGFWAAPIIYKTPEVSCQKLTVMSPIEPFLHIFIKFSYPH